MDYENLVDAMDVDTDERWYATVEEMDIDTEERVEPDPLLQDYHRCLFCQGHVTAAIRPSRRSDDVEIIMYRCQDCRRINIH